jgi:hypothetical protein
VVGGSTAAGGTICIAESQLFLGVRMKVIFNATINFLFLSLLYAIIRIARRYSLGASLVVVVVFWW